MADLGGRADAIRNRAVAPEEDNMLKVSGDGRRAALDLRLVGLPQTVPGKIAAAADRIAAIWRAHRDDEYQAPDGTPYPVRGSLQLVFCDLGTPGPGLERLRRTARPAHRARPAARVGPVRPRGQAPTPTWPGCSPPAGPGTSPC